MFAAKFYFQCSVGAASHVFNDTIFVLPPLSSHPFSFFLSFFFSFFLSLFLSFFFSFFHFLTPFLSLLFSSCESCSDAPTLPLYIHLAPVYTPCPCIYSGMAALLRINLPLSSPTHGYGPDPSPFACLHIRLLTHSPVYTFACLHIHLFAHSPVYTFACLHIRLLTHSPVYTFACLHIHLFTHSPAYTFACLHIHLLTHSPVYTFTCSHIHLFTHSPDYTFTCLHIHLFTHSPVHTFTCLHLCLPAQNVVTDKATGSSSTGSGPEKMAFSSVVSFPSQQPPLAEYSSLYYFGGKAHMSIFLSYLSLLSFSPIFLSYLSLLFFSRFYLSLYNGGVGIPVSTFPFSSSSLSLLLAPSPCLFHASAASV